MQFPLAHPSDGLIDIVVQELVSHITLETSKNIFNKCLQTSRKRLLSYLGDAHKGASFWDDTVRYTPRLNSFPFTDAAHL